jgi:hypothetical protein
MSKIRVLHNGTIEGKLFISDLNQGTGSIDSLDWFKKQPVYVPKLQSYVENGRFRVIPKSRGFIDLVLSSDVVMSLDQGVLKSFVDQGFITIVSLKDVTIDTASQDTQSKAVQIEGKGFGSDNQEKTQIILEDALGAEVTLDQDQVVSFSDTLILIQETEHNLTEEVVKVTVVRNPVNNPQQSESPVAQI